MFYPHHHHFRHHMFRHHRGGCCLGGCLMLPFTLIALPFILLFGPRRW